PPTGASEDQLRADAVRGRREVAALVERVEPREGAEARRAGRLDGRAQPLDDGPGGRQRDPSCGVAVLGTQGASVRRWSAGPPIWDMSRGQAPGHVLFGPLA